MEAALSYIKLRYHETARTESEFMIDRVIEVSRTANCAEYEWPLPSDAER